MTISTLAHLPKLRKLLISLLLIVCGLIATQGWLDQLAESYTEQGIKRTLITYGITRGMNGLISVAQGTEVAVSPAGIGMSFAPGQILDPINDLIERFSWVVLASGTSLGIQRLLLEISTSALITYSLIALSILMIVILWLDRLQVQSFNYKKLVARMLWVLILVRFSIPLIAVINEALYVSFLQPKYDHAQQQLQKVSTELELMNEQHSLQAQPDTQDAGLLQKAQNWLQQTQQSLDIEKQIEQVKYTAEQVSQQVINMIVVFVVQSIVFPLLFLWLLIKFGRMTMARLDFS